MVVNNHPVWFRSAQEPSHTFISVTTAALQLKGKMYCTSTDMNAIFVPPVHLQLVSNEDSQLEPAVPPVYVHSHVYFVSSGLFNKGRRWNSFSCCSVKVEALSG